MTPRLSRLDQALVERGYFPSREQARRGIMAGEVFVDGRRRDKAGEPVAEEAAIEVRSQRPRFVSRGGDKLEGALRHFDVVVAGRVCIDVGASTGGFTDCLLQHGAARVYAVDVGYGQLDQKLRNDPRVVVHERVNARRLEPGGFPDRFELATVDVSFISLRLVVPAVLPLMRFGAELVTLIKPQFEVGREGVGRGGVVRDQELRLSVVAERVRDLTALGLIPLGQVDSVLAGPAGNREVFAYFRLGPGTSEDSI